MKPELLLQKLLEKIRQKTPPGTNMAGMLSDILYMGKEAVYRRLRGEVPFSFYEISVISEKLGISLDSITCNSDPHHNLLHMDLMRFESPRDIDQKFYRRILDVLAYITRDPDSEVGTCANVIPIMFLLKYRNLARFKIFKWLYQYEPAEQVKAFHEIGEPFGRFEFCEEMIQAHRNINQAYYIFDSRIFLSFVNQVNYFTEVQLVRKEDKEGIKSDLFLLIDEMEEAARKGAFETGKKMQMYISNLPLEDTYSYYKGKTFGFTLIKFFSINSITTESQEILSKMQNWIQSLKRLSTQISESGEIQRVKFFAEQRELVNTL